MTSTYIDSFLKESRRFEPTSQFAGTANVDAKRYREMQEFAAIDHEGFWAEQAKKLVWQKPWQKTLDWNLPRANWFVGGQLNVTETCLDQHLATWRKNKAAIVWEGERGETRTLTYLQLHQEVCALAGHLRELGIQKGDRVAIYMPMVPEIAVAMLACARIGATHSVIFGGFSKEAVRHRIQDAGCAAVITAEGGYRKGQFVALKKTVEEALGDGACPTVRNLVVMPTTGNSPAPFSQRGKNAAEGVEAGHPLFILYTSGTTGKPKGIVHSTGGYLTQVRATTEWVFDIKDDDIYWCTADAGWITGHSYVVYGPLACGATIFMYEGAPLYPTPSRFWEMIERHRVTIFYTAPTAIRTFMRMGDEHIRGRDLSSLRLLGTVGEPINPEAWMWYRETIGGGRCPIVDTWWQTETGAIMIAPLPGVTTTIPGSATKALPGIAMDIVDSNLVARKPWPSMSIGIYGDMNRFTQTYWSQVPGSYFTGDGARKDSDDYFWIMGRIDDVVNVSGHRIGTMEVESALVEHPAVAEAAVVAKHDEIRGQAIVAFVTLKDSQTPSTELKTALYQQVADEIGSFARPAEIRFAKSLPKTRSGKIMRRLLGELANAGKITGDTTTLEDFSAVAELS